MRDFNDTTLWQVSEFERLRAQSGHTGYQLLERPTRLSTTLLGELQTAQRSQGTLDVIELLAACLRHRSAALIYFECGNLVWPITLFPAEMVYHSPRDVMAARPSELASLKARLIESPGVRPPGDRMSERVAAKDCYRALLPALWTLAIDGPGEQLVGEIAGTAAYRLLRDPAREGLAVPAAMMVAVQRLLREPASLREIARWPGMGLARAARLVNGLYLTSNLIVSRTHPAARHNEERLGFGLFGRRH